MQNFGMEPRASSTSTTVTAEKAFSFLSKGWREVRDSADADLQLMRKRANTIINLADRELENFLNSTVSVKSSNPSPFLAVPSSSSIAEFEFVKRISPKISEFQRTYSSQDFSRKVLEKWAPRSKIGIDLSAVRSALVSSEAEANRSIIDFDGERRGLRWKVQGEEDEGKEWEPIRRLKVINGTVIQLRKWSDVITILDREICKWNCNTITKMVRCHYNTGKGNM